MNTTSSTNTGTVNVNTPTGTINFNGTSIGTSSYMAYNDPYEYSKEQILEFFHYDDRIEIICRKDPSQNWSYTPSVLIGNYPYYNSLQPKIYKKIIKPVDGVLKVVEIIEGQYVPAREESYLFP